jgi:hypothetical protein
VVRINFGPGNRDRVEVFRNPESLIDENTCIVEGELTGNFAFDRISLGNFHGTKDHEVDEIRVGTTFRAVTGRRSRGPDRLMPRVAMTPAASPLFAHIAFSRDALAERGQFVNFRSDLAALNRLWLVE